MMVEKVRYEVKWRNFKKGMSIFIPCLDGEQALKDINVVFKRLKIKIVSKIVLVDGIRGLRIWRM